MNKQKVCTILFLLSCCRYNCTCEEESKLHASTVEATEAISPNLRETSPEVRASATPCIDSIPDLDLPEESKTPKSREATTAISTLTLPQQQIVLQHISHHAQEVEIDVLYVHTIAFEFVGKRFNEKVGYDDKTLKDGIASIKSEAHIHHR